MNNTYWLYDSSFCVGVDPTEKNRHGGWECDWAIHACLLRVLKKLGFSIELDTKGTSWRYRSLRKFHRLARRGDLLCAIEIYPAGSKFEFFQEIVTENRNGGRYDFNRVSKMPYLVRKSFERSIAALGEDLDARGFTNTTKARSPIPDPLAYFNEIWDSEYERLRGTHRFERDESGWPSARELGHWSTKDLNGVPLTQGAVRYARNAKGYLIRGKVFGGINGMWTFIYGPGKRDFNCFHARELFTCNPASVPRKQYAYPEKGRQRAAERVRQRMADAVKVEDFETAARLRDHARKIEAQVRAA